MKNLKRQILSNAAISVLQSIVSGIILFILYRYLLESIGIVKMGIWSVVLATASASRISELGITGSVVKYIAKYIAQNKRQKAAELLETAAISLTLLIGCIILLAYIPLIWVLTKVITSSSQDLAVLVLPYALFSLWLLVISGVFQAGLEGCQRIDLSQLLMISGNILYYFLAVSLVPEFELMGLAYAQLIQACFLVFGSWFLLRANFVEIRFFPYRWRLGLLKEMLSYGVNFQITAILQLLFEPLTKLMLSKFGNLEMVGFFEMANRMISQFRMILISANRVLVPVIANYEETNRERIQSVYKRSYRLLVYLSLPFFGGLMAFTPLISELWIGYFEEIFVLFTCISISGWLVNTLAGPAYFINLGRGRLQWNTISHVMMGLLNVLLGMILGINYGGMGVVLAWLIALVLGSSLLLFTYHIENSIPVRDVFPKESMALFLSVACAIGLTWFVFAYRELTNESMMLLMISSLLVFNVSISRSLWRHPMRSVFSELVFRRTTSHE